MQRARCQELWLRALAFTGFSILPFLIVGIFLLWIAHRVGQFYRTARKSIQSGKALSMARVTQPAEAPGDVFSWAHCLHRVSVQLANRQQLMIYLDREMEIPEPGQSMAVFDAGTSFGVKRHVGIVYFPHVAVVSSRKR